MALMNCRKYTLALNVVMNAVIAPGATAFQLLLRSRSMTIDPAVNL